MILYLYLESVFQLDYFALTNAPRTIIGEGFSKGILKFIAYIQN